MNLAVNRSSELPPSANNQSSRSVNMPSKPKISQTDSSENPNPLKADDPAQSLPNQKRLHPIPPPSHPRQYRAIGLIKGKYQLSGEQLTQGTLQVTDDVKIEAVLLGRVISLVKNHLDLEKEHLWVVYPRTKQDQDHLHVQIVGVWEPETLSQDKSESTSSSEPEDGYFSIRGEIVYYSQENHVVIVKIKQFPRKESDKVKFFKLQLKGNFPEKPMGRFWDLKVTLEGETLVIAEANDLGFIPSKRKPPYGKGKPRYSKYPSKRPKPSTSQSSVDSRPIIKGKKPTLKKPESGDSNS